MAIANNQYNRAIYPNLQVSADGQSLVKSGSFSPTDTQIGPNMSKVNAPDPTLENMKYNTNMLTYPEKLKGSPDLQHYVTFYINIKGKSKYRNDPNYKNAAPIPFDETGRVNRANVGQSMNQLTEIIAAGTGAKLGVSGAASAVAKYGGSLNGKAKLVSVLGAGVIGAGVGYGVANYANMFEPDTSYRISSAINLAVTDRPSVKYGVDYQSTDLGLAAGLMQGSGSIVDAVGRGMAPEAVRSMLLNVAQIPASIASAFGSDFNPAAMASLGTGTTPNPFREQIFKSVDNRTFNFEYKFLPRSASEAKGVENIIKMFKFHMHPEVSAGGLFYIYPSEFNIVYMYKGKENPHVNKISTCVLENMTVDYGSQGGFNTFADGTPTEITMRLQFKELEVLTKERIVKGF